MTTAPLDLTGLPPLLAQMREAFKKRIATLTNQCVGPTLEPVELTEADCEESDMCIHRWKLNGGPARDNERRALNLQMSHQAQTGRFL